MWRKQPRRDISRNDRTMSGNSTFSNDWSLGTLQSRLSSRRKRNQRGRGLENLRRRRRRNRKWQRGRGLFSGTANAAVDRLTRNIQGIAPGLIDHAINSIIDIPKRRLERFSRETLLKIKNRIRIFLGRTPLKAPQQLAIERVVDRIQAALLRAGK